MSLPTIVKFTSYRPLDLRAGEAEVLELPVAHPIKLNDRPLDLAGEVGHPPCFDSGYQAAAPRPNPDSSRCVECRTHDQLQFHIRFRRCRNDMERGLSTHFLPSKSNSEIRLRQRVAHPCRSNAPALGGACYK